METTSAPPASSDRTNIPPRFGIYCISDLHVDFPENLAWVEALPSHKAPGTECALIVAGDSTDRIDLLRRSLQALKAKFDHVFFTFGNHELWVREGDASANSFEKHEAIKSLCHTVGVHTAPVAIFDGKAVITPLPSWYDASLRIQAPWDDPNRVDYGFQFWNDFHLCKWGKDLPSSSATPEEDAATLAMLRGVVQRFHVEARHNANTTAALVRQHTEGTGTPPVVVSFSHFYSNKEQLGPLVELARKSYKGGSDPLPNFTCVAGSAELQPIIDSVQPAVHVIGHSHRAFDIKGSDGVRYVHYPLAYPQERNAKKVTLTTNGPMLVWSEPIQ